MKESELKNQYDKLFPSDKEKAEAFDRIAEQFYYCNFGTMQKSDIETLLFSLYLDRILNISEENIQSYSDYTLSKYLGITQSRVSALKIRKELKYPYPGFDWKKSFARISENAQYEKGKIKIHIPDRNLYIEIQNAVESLGGYIDIQLNRNLLQLSPEHFIGLILEISEETERKKIIETIRKKSLMNKKSIEDIEKKTIGKLITEDVYGIAVNTIFDILTSCISVTSPAISAIIKNICNAIQNKIKSA